jgi:hypothetical protein
MSEEQLVEHAQTALRKGGIDDEIVAAGEFYPRGHTGSAFAGGLIGGEAGGVAGSLGDAIGTAGGYLAGAAAGDSATGLPGDMLVAVSSTAVYGFAVKHRSAEPTALIFQVAREGLETKVHQRVNVRVLELIHRDGGSRIELEGNRIPLTHSKDVIDELTG